MLIINYFSRFQQPIKYANNHPHRINPLCWSGKGLGNWLLLRLCGTSITLFQHDCNAYCPGLPHEPTLHLLLLAWPAHRNARHCLLLSIEYSMSNSGKGILASSLPPMTQAPRYRQAIADTPLSSLANSRWPIRLAKSSQSYSKALSSTKCVFPALCGTHVTSLVKSCSQEARSQARSATNSVTRGKIMYSIW